MTQTTKNILDFIRQNCWIMPDEDETNINDARKILKRHGYYIGPTKCGGWDAVA